MRIAVIIIAVIHLAIWVFGTTRGPAMPDAIGGDTFWTAMGIGLAIVTTPALILAITGRFLKAALALALVSELFLFLAWIMGW